jgi:hypothetical protein
MSYLARLKALNAEKHLPDELTKLTKAPPPFVSNSERELTEAAKSPSVSFVSNRGKAFSENIGDWEECAAHLEYDAGLPRDWAEPIARLLYSGPPGDFDPVRWQRILDGGLKFADQWGAKAYQLGWQADDIFGLHPTAPAARNDRKGIAWLLDRARVAALDGAGADIVTAQGSRQRFYRKANTSASCEAKE